MTKRIDVDASGKLVIAEVAPHNPAPEKPAKRHYTRPTWPVRARALVVTQKGRDYLRELAAEKAAELEAENDKL